jgi:hypothetical protein
MSSIALSASGGMPLRPGAFPYSRGFMVHLTSARVVNQRHALLLFKEVQDGMVYWSMVVNHFVEVRTKY